MSIGPCKAQKAMNMVDKEGFSAYKAEGWCDHFSGQMTFDGGANPRIGALWRTYKFDDGSSMNITKNGCSIFYSEDDKRKWIHWPSNGPKRLF